MSTESQSDDEIIKNMVKLTCHDMDEATLYECELRESKNWINRFKNDYELALTNRDPRLLEVLMLY